MRKKFYLSQSTLFLGRIGMCWDVYTHIYTQIIRIKIYSYKLTPGLENTGKLHKLGSAQQNSVKYGYYD